MVKPKKYGLNRHLVFLIQNETKVPQKSDLNKQVVFIKKDILGRNNNQMNLKTGQVIFD